ncbi:MAG: c-type cytochrome [Gammaproteobacteria bacterium]|nr:c-type cytochrome [Gammaproteobacteria bacterium]
MIRRLCMLTVTGMLFMGMAGSALADGSSLYQAKACLGCHGVDAKTPPLPIYPKLAGQSADYAFNQMKAIKSGARSSGQSAIMKGIMVMVSEDEMREIADWLSTL